MRVITGTARGKRLKTPEGLLTRPTSDRVKEGIFSAVQFEVRGSVFLDLFAGTGQMGIEAMSRGAAKAVFVDARQEACKLVKDNLRLTGFEKNTKVVQSDYLAFLENTKEKYDIIFLDPPYAEVFMENSLKKISEIDILTDCGIIICERPVEKELDVEIPGLFRCKDYRYGKTLVTIYRCGDV